MSNALRLTEEQLDAYQKRRAPDGTVAATKLPVPARVGRRMIALTLPYPPSVNHYWMTKGKARFICAAGKLFREQVAWIVRGKRLQSITGRLSVEVELSPPDNRKRDLDNALKALLDGLEHAGVYADDSHIDYLVISRQPVVKGGSCEVRVSAMTV